MKKQYCRIRVGAVVFSDHSFPIWGEHIGVGEELRPFEMSPMDTSHNRYDCRAWGYGLHKEPGAYGNGSLFVRAEDIEILDSVNVTEVHRPALPQPPKPEKKSPGHYLIVGDGYSDLVQINSSGLVRELGKEQLFKESNYDGNPQWYGPLDLHEIMMLETAKTLLKSKLPVDLEKARLVYRELSDGFIK